jgi:hypothetical protein
MSILGNQTDWSRAQDKAREDVNNSFGTIPYNCQTLDIELKRLNDLILVRTKITDSGNLAQRAYLEALNLKKDAWENLWALKGCRDVIEKIRLKTGAILTTESAIQAESSVLTTSNKEQNIYIGIGAIIILTGLYIVLKK